MDDIDSEEVPMWYWPTRGNLFPWVSLFKAYEPDPTRRDFCRLRMTIAFYWLNWCWFFRLWNAGPTNAYCPDWAEKIREAKRG